MLQNLSMFGTPIICSIITGFFAIYGSILGIKKSFQNLELEEIKKQKTQCVISLFGSQWIIADNLVATDEDRSRFMYEFNKIYALWGDNKKIIDSVNNFIITRTNEKYICLLRNIANDTKIQLKYTSDENMLHPFLIGLNR
jgi:hypothetical protein